MVLKRPLLILVACLLPLSVVACSSSSGDDAQVVPEGTHYGYVVSKASVPTTNDQARTYGLDLGGAKSGTPDGTVDNRLGEVLGALAGMGFAIQATVDAAVAQGSIILLVDLQTKDFASSSATGFSVKLGATPMPAPCTDATDKVCGHHLTGSGTFTLAADSPKDALVSGKIVGGTFTGGPGNIDLQIALGSTQPITLSLLNARAKATSISATGMTATVGGALSVTDLNGQVIPAITTQVAAVVTKDCTGVGGPPTCGCTASSTGLNLLNLFDGDLMGSVHDCKISNEEIAGNAVIKSLLGPDVCSSKSCTAPDALSLGIQVTAVKATFPM
jgi:hypothetical protein